MRKNLTEAALLSKYFTVLTESSDILSHFGSNINPALRKAVIQLHQDKKFSHEAGAITQVDKVTWRDIKGSIATNYSQGTAIAIVGTNGSIVVTPRSHDGGWNGMLVTNDMQATTVYDNSINILLRDIKDQLGKPKEFYKIRYKKPKDRYRNSNPNEISHSELQSRLLKRLNPLLAKRAVKAKAEVNSMIINMIKGDVNDQKLSKKIRQRQNIMNFLEDPEKNQSLAETVLMKALVATINYYDPDTRVNYNTPGTYGGISNLFWSDRSGTMNKIKNNDMPTLATVAYFIERAWLSL